MSKTATNLNPDPLLSEEQTAAYLGVTPRTLAVWRCMGRYNLPYVKTGRLVRYKQSDLDAWIARRTVGTSEKE